MYESTIWLFGVDNHGHADYQGPETLCCLAEIQSMPLPDCNRLESCLWKQDLEDSGKRANCHILYSVSCLHEECL